MGAIIFLYKTTISKSDVDCYYIPKTERGYNLEISYFDYRELSKLAERTRMIETDFVELITNNGGNIKSYDNYEQFVQADL